MIAKVRLPCPAGGCRRVFRSAVALTFHVRAEHPSGAGEFRPELREARVAERKVKAESLEERARKTLDHLYRMGCPCGHDFEWHHRQSPVSGAGP